MDLRYLHYYKETEFSEHLNQGDIINGLSSLDRILSYEDPQAVGILILNNTCDLAHGNVNYVSFCPIYTLNSYIDRLLPKFISKVMETEFKNNLKNARKKSVSSYQYSRNSSKEPT